MRARYPGPGELVAGAGGLVLLLAMFLPWFGLNGRARVPGSGEVITVGRGEVNAWEAFSGIDVLLLLVAALAIALLVPYLVKEIRKGKVSLGPRIPDGASEPHPGRRGNRRPAG